VFKNILYLLYLNIEGNLQERRGRQVPDEPYYFSPNYAVKSGKK